MNQMDNPVMTQILETILQNQNKIHSSIKKINERLGSVEICLTDLQSDVEQIQINSQRSVRHLRQITRQMELQCEASSGMSDVGSIAPRRSRHLRGRRVQESDDSDFDGTLANEMRSRSDLDSLISGDGSIATKRQMQLNGQMSVQRSLDHPSHSQSQMSLEQRKSNSRLDNINSWVSSQHQNNNIGHSEGQMTLTNQIDAAQQQKTQEHQMLNGSAVDKEQYVPVPEQKYEATLPVKSSPAVTTVPKNKPTSPVTMSATPVPSAVTNGGRNSNIQPKTPSETPARQKCNIKYDNARSYLDSVGIGVKDQVILEAVQRAFKVPGPGTHLPPGLFTILLLDISNSIHEDLLKQIKIFITNFVNEVEDSAASHQLEEIMSIITFGGICDILQEFTNDYSPVRDSLDNVRKGGKSPMLIGLAMALAYMHMEGNPVVVHGKYVQPRIILISDGFLTDEVNILTDGDFETNSIMCQSRVFNFLPALQQEGITISCVGVGECNEVFLKDIAKSCRGTYNKISVESAKTLGRYYHYQAPKVQVKNEMEETDNNGDPVQIMLKYTQDTYNNDDRTEILNLLRIEGIPVPDDVSLPVENDIADGVFDSAAEANIPLTNVSERDDDEILDRFPDQFIRLPPLGTRVKRGLNWQWHDQDKNKPGTVVAHEKEDTVVVKWDCGNFNTYPVQSLEKISEYRKLGQQDSINVGCLVKRGRDWKRGDENGSADTLGVVVRKHNNKTVTVRWPLGIMDVYKVGEDGINELEYVSEKVTETHEGGPYKQSLSVICWQWQDKMNQDQWRTLDEESSTKLESMVGKNGTTIIIHKGIQLRCDPKSLKFKEIDGKRDGKLQRQMVTPEMMATYQVMEAQI